ncbi:hypothetical protein DFH08DRAFT_833127 [Mycena albidolilacea]|uniref:BTB domain-containing protein n=1 Tax=Mycena albidolilacea TaxID=1033008 RepID=A0AAD7AWP0_9AGAR|nr:hypothetical protein DFH08DRAFT_833127 [Mycena albidolilacea]
MAIFKPISIDNMLFAHSYSHGDARILNIGTMYAVFSFCALDADITILSADGVLFKVHRKNLEIVHLLENPDPEPDLNNVEFATIAGLAKAAEKYVVYFALEWCHMRRMQYVARRHHVNLANQSAGQSVGYQISQALTIIPRAKFHDWILGANFLGLTMSKYKKDIPLLLKCVADPTPLFTFHNEIEKSNYKGIFCEMMDIKFMPEAGDAK